MSALSRAGKALCVGVCQAVNFRLLVAYVASDGSTLPPAPHLLNFLFLKEQSIFFLLATPAGMRAEENAQETFPHNFLLKSLTP